MALTRQRAIFEKEGLFIKKHIAGQLGFGQVGESEKVT